MSNPVPDPISTDDLHAYADGRLPPDRAAEVEAYLAAQPAAARQVADYRAINAALHRAFDGVLDEPIPAAHADAASRRRPHLSIPAAAAVAGVLLGAFGGWIARGEIGAGGAPAAQVAEHARAAYLVYAPETRHPVEVAAADSGHLAAWLSNRMGMAFPLPSLADLGFTLVGGRLMVGDRGPAALLMYENPQGRRMVLYVRNDLPEAGRGRMRYDRGGEAGVVYWTDGRRGFGLSGGFSEAELMPAAHVVRAQFSAS